MWRLGKCRFAHRLIGCLLGIAGLLVTATPTRPQAPIADAPTFLVGDQWRYTDGTVFRILAVEGDLVVTTDHDVDRADACLDCRFYRDRNLTIVKVLDKNGKLVSDANVGFKALDFPLQIGKRWTVSQQLRRRSDRALVHFDSTFTVEGYEEVQTKAGTFKAFKIRMEMRGGNWGGVATFWYSPEAKVVVKRYTADARWRFDRELESYTLK